MKYSRCYDRERQLLGIDIVARNNNKDYFIDEKCATDCWYRDLSTFAFELSYELCDKKTQTRTGNRVPGWFVNPNVKTDIYALGYVRANTKEDFLENKIFRFEVVFVKKKRLQEYIEKHIGGVDKLQCLDVKIREDAKNGTLKPYGSNGKNKYRISVANGIYVCWSPNLAESPVNVIIDKKILKKIAFRSIVVNIE